MKILAIVVLYHPHEAHVSKLIDILLASHCKVMLVDNAIVSDVLLNQIRQKAGCHYVRSAKNIGTSGAHNIGINYALKQEFDFVVIFDQDSTVTPKLIPNLLKTYKELTAQGIKVAAVGPSFYDPRVKSTWRNRWHWVKTHRAYWHLISSGMLIPVQALAEIGKMDDSLFLDWVDIEWCYRAKSCGYKTYRSATAIMAHTIGEIRPVLGGLFQLRYNAPWRDYHFYKNLICLTRERRLPLKLALRGIPKRLLKILFLKDKKAYLKNAYLGMVDGLKTAKPMRR